MRKTILAGAAAVLTLFSILALAPKTAAQISGDEIRGRILDYDGKPWPGVTVELIDDTNRRTTTKSDKDGRWSQGHLKPGVYTIHLTKPDQNLDFNFKYQLRADVSADVAADVNFKELGGSSGVNPAEVKKKQQEQEEQQKQFTGMKAHFEAGVAAMNQAAELQTKLRATPRDQRGPIQEQLNGIYQTATNEFLEAQKATKEKDSNLPTILSNLGAAYEAAGQYDKAAEEFQQAIALKPTQGSFYSALGTNLARVGKIPDASAACDKAATLDPANAGSCWRNVGIVLSNTGKMKEAIEPLQKGTQADPKNADGWYLLAMAMLSSIDTKQVGDKLTYTIPPGTAEAYQKYLDIAPTGPHAQDCKDALASLASMGEGVDTKITRKKK